MTDVERLLLEAWEKLGPGIMGDHDELQRRLARRRSALLTRPQRAWCLCLRASDRRITPMDWIITPMHAMDLNHPDHPYEPIEHTVTIQPHGLRKFCRAVRTDSWGELVENVARQLGVPPTGLNPARCAGLFTERFVKGLGGRRGPHPVPLIHSWKTLDPSGPMFRRPEQLWGSLWEFMPDMIPDNFEQTIRRKPKFSVWGTARGRYRTKAPADHLFSDDVRSIGWRWVCPACKKDVRKIYYPLPPQTLFDFLGYDPARSTSCQAQSKEFQPYDADDMPTPPATFACGDCHNIAYTTRTRPTAWNEIVSWLTRGMLYGHEVEKPHWYQPERKATRHRRLGKPAAKREAVFNRLRLGWPVENIALHLKMSRKAVQWCIWCICKQEGVKNRHQLAAKLCWSHPQPLNRCEMRCQLAHQRDEIVEPLLLDGLLYRQIAQKLQTAVHNVETAAARIYRRHGAKRRKEFMHKFAPAQNQEILK